MSDKQVEKRHYEFSRYVDKARWASNWHQIDEILRLNPENVLEIGPGPGIFKAVASKLGVHVETMDVDPELEPDHVGSADNMPFEAGRFDVVCAFQVLEHLPFERSLEAMKEMSRVARRHILISLPDASRPWHYSLHVPRVGAVKFLVPRPTSRPRVKHVFDGEHHWELSTKGFEAEQVAGKFETAANLRLTKMFLVHENSYHRFMIFEKNT